MAYLLDSDVLISYLDGDQATVTLVNDLVPAGVSISIVAYMESYQGVLQAANPLLSERRHANVVRSMAILPFNESTARICARLRHQLSGEGRRVRSRVLDLMIAATALEHDLTLVTRNVVDYRDIPGLSVA